MYRAVSRKIRSIADAMVGEFFSPDFAAADFLANGVRISAFDQLHGAFNDHSESRGDKQMHMIGHQDEGVELEASLAAIVVKGF
jgi:hypothetical protein